MADLDDVYELQKETHGHVIEIGKQVAVNENEIKNVGKNLSKHEKNPMAHRDDNRKDAAVVLTSKQVAAVIGVAGGGILVLQQVLNNVG